MAASRNKILAVRHTRGIQSLFQLHGLGRIHGMIAVAIHNERRRQPRPHIRQWRHLLSQFQNCRARRRPSSRLSPWRSDSRIRAHIVRSSSRHGSISRQWTVERQPLVRKVGTAVFRQSLRQICRPKEIEHRRHLRLVSASRWVERCRCVCTHQREVSACGPAVQDHPAGIEVIFNGILLHPRHRAANVFNRCRSRSIFGIPVLHCHHAHPRRQQRAERPVRAWTVPSNPASSPGTHRHANPSSRPGQCQAAGRVCLQAFLDQPLRLDWRSTGRWRKQGCPSQSDGPGSSLQRSPTQAPSPPSARAPTHTRAVQIPEGLPHTICTLTFQSAS
jgi:hypothetical protein